MTTLIIRIKSNKFRNVKKNTVNFNLLCHSLHYNLICGVVIGCVSCLNTLSILYGKEAKEESIYKYKLVDIVKTHLPLQLQI